MLFLTFSKQNNRNIMLGIIEYADLLRYIFGIKLQNVLI